MVLRCKRRDLLALRVVGSMRGAEGRWTDEEMSRAKAMLEDEADLAVTKFSVHVGWEVLKVDRAGLERMYIEQELLDV